MDEPYDPSRGDAVLAKLEDLFQSCEPSFLKEVLAACDYDEEEATNYVVDALNEDNRENSQEEYDDSGEDDPAPEEQDSDDLTPAARELRQRAREPMLRLEYKKLCKKMIPGMYIMPQLNPRDPEEKESDETSPFVADFTRWHGVLFLRRGFYRGGIFKFLIDIPFRYPDQLPTITFRNKIFHVLVDPKTNRLDLSPRFRVPRENKFFLSHVCEYIKDVFFFPALWRDARELNHAFKMWNDFLEGINEQFLESVKETCKLSVEQVYDNVPSPFKFSKLRDSQFLDMNRKLKIADEETRKEKPDPRKSLISLLKN